MIDFVGVAWVWSMLSELLAYPNGWKFPLGQRGSDNEGWTVFVCNHTTVKMSKLCAKGRNVHVYNIPLNEINEKPSAQVHVHVCPEDHYTAMQAT